MGAVELAPSPPLCGCCSGRPPGCLAQCYCGQDRLHNIRVEHPYSYHDGFYFRDLNLNAASVSQDSYLVRVPAP